MWIKNWLSNEPKPTAVCAGVSVVSLVLSLGGWLRALPVDIAWIAIVLCGIPIVVGAATALITEHDIKADVLVSIALIAAVVTKEYFAAGEVALIMQIGSLLEDYTANRAQKGIESLIQMTPQTARVTRGGKQELLPVEQVAVGDEITVLAGETIPVDGVILSGETSIDPSVMTGESIPVDMKTGDEVISGAVNQYGTFTMRATRIGSNSSLQRMIALAEEADANKAPIVGLADRWATYMVFIALACAVAVGLISGEVQRAVTVLVVFCPCAFILATPTAVAAAIGNVTKYGILIRTGDALERLSKVKYMAFDKTGTLTYGRPEVIGVAALDAAADERTVLTYAAYAEQRSEHPLGKAILQKARETGIRLEACGDAEILAGQGVRTCYNGRELLIGKPQLLEAEGVSFAAARQLVQDYYDKGATVIYLSVDGKAFGLVALSDRARENAREMVARLKEQGIAPMLLTGDNEAAANAVARSVGIDEVRSNLLPQDKASVIQAYAAQGKEVCMVGDGVNDALALSAAYAGIAMGGVGSDIAVESADAVLVSDDVRRLPYLMDMTRKTMAKIRQNIIISLCINFGAIILSSLGILTPVSAALVHNCGSVFVVVNAALLLRERDGHE